MSIDATVTGNLMQTLEDGKEGYAKGAEKLARIPELAEAFQRFSEQRSVYYSELEAMAKTYGDNIEESGTIVGALHRGWMAMKAALSGDSPEGVIDAAEQGEDHAKSAYEDAMTMDISPALRTLVERQYTGVKAAHDAVKSLRDSVKSGSAKG